MRLLSVVLIFLVTLSACSRPEMAVRGDSTAIASRGGFSKVFDVVPSLDGRRWWNIVRCSRPGHVVVFNDGVGGQDIDTLRAKMEADKAHQTVPTIIYDRRNKGETADHYEAQLAAAIATLNTDRFLIMPQVPGSRGFAEPNADQLETMATIDRRVRTRWPNNTFSEAEAAALIAVLEPDSTRIDGLHRNTEGQAIEAGFITAWIDRHDFKSQAKVKTHRRGVE